MSGPNERMSDAEFEMRVRTEGMWTAEATGEKAPTLLALEARRARSSELALGVEVEMVIQQRDAEREENGRLQKRVEELESTLEHISKHGYGGGA